MERVRAWLHPQSSQWPVLAGVRFFMALTVVVYHLFIVRPNRGVPVLEDLGGLGCICGFLSISGYSIAHSISTQPRGFFARRAWRIFPVYYVTMLLALVPYLFIKGAPPFRFGFGDFTRSEVVGSIFFLQSFVTEKIPIFGPSWTLAIEWWFYMAAPLFVRMRPWMLWGVVAISLVAQKEVVDRGLVPIHNYLWGMPALVLLWAWLSGFLFYRAPGWSALLVALVGYQAVSRFTDHSPAAYLVAAFAVVTAKSLPPMPRFLARALNWLGDLSYPLYLAHVPLMAWTARWTKWSDPYAFVGLALAGAALLYHLVDAPLRSRFSTRPAKALAAPPVVTAAPSLAAGGPSPGPGAVSS
jgi:peptidoglycan/LPS O-acetylase OafA/YrhL